MTDKKKILIHLSSDDAKFFSELLARDDVEIVSEPDDTDFMLISHEEYKLLSEKIAKLSEEKDKKLIYELKTPLASVKGYAEVMLAGLTGQITEQQENFLRVIVSNAQRTIDIVDNLREPISNYVPQFEPINITTTIISTLDSIQKNYPEINIPGFTYEASLPLVYANEKLLEEALYYLFLYAYEKGSLQNTPKINIEIQKDILQVSISPVDINDDFNVIAYFRNYPNKKETPQQMNLLRAKIRIQNNDGELWVDKPLGSPDSTTFHFTIPIAQENTPND